MLIKYKIYYPKIGKNCFITDSSELIGNIIIGDNVSIWYGSVLRGDINYIKIGNNSNIQDLSTVHLSEIHPVEIGQNVTIGHSANIHGCIIKDNCLIGIGSTILDGSVVGEGSLIAAGSIVPPNSIIPPRSLVMGIPGKTKKKVSDKQYNDIIKNAENYVILKNEYLKKF